MSAKTDFIRAIVQEGITAARKYFGTAIQKDIPTKEIERAKQKFKNNKKDATARKNTANKKADKKRAKANTTQLKKTSTRNDQEGMGLDATTGRDVRAAADVDKGKSGKVTRSAEPGFLQQERTAGSRAKAKEKVDLAKKVRDGDATEAEKDRLKRLRAKDEVDTVSATAKGASTRTKNTKATLPSLKSIPTAKSTREKPPIELTGKRAGLINEEVFDKLSPGKQEQAVRNAMARIEGPRKRELKAMLDNIAPTKAGETGVRARKGGPKGMSGATSKNIKDIDGGVGGRGGLDFNRGGKVTKRAIGSHDFRMNKGGLLLSSVDNRKNK